jgi:hypothetical protein
MLDTTCPDSQFISKNSLYHSVRFENISKQFFRKSPYQNSTVDMLQNLPRTKRWIFTSFLGAVSGLAPEQEVKDMKTEEEAMKKVESSNTKEINVLISKYNNIIDGLGSQNKKILELYKSEKDLELCISDLLSERLL